MNNKSKYVFVAPAFIVLLIVSVYPMLYSIFTSFTNISVAGQKNYHFVGLQNFGDVLTQGFFLKAVSFTVRYALATVLIEMQAGLLIALMIDKIRRGKPLVITLMNLPLVVAPVVYGIVFQLLLNQLYGPLSYYLNKLGFHNPGITTPKHAFWWLVIVDILQWTPFMALILYAGLQSVSQDALEAADVDGANSWQKFWHISFYSVRPYLGIAVLFRGMDALKVFDNIVVLTSGGPGVSTVSASLSIDQMAFSSFSLSHATAATLLFLILVSIIATIIVRIFRRDLSNLN